ncbi:hypothetical protein HMN09_00854700 [Mycena chlorophos]|uniref:DUF6699 domain-containing protein n=1 Tax=Mycena chlorophos TaxID=658473 RepID=A0A8H6SS70_MYCCL|nr:hypothetical protein HMN09_00854700 [Mycena chlorophos]
MPGRHVRFSSENKYYSPRVEPSSIPLPTTPTSISSAPLSPHSHGHHHRHHSRHSSPTLPPLYAPRRAHTLAAPPRAVAHRALAHAEHQLLHYDVSLPPSTMTSNASYSPLPSSVLNEPAAYPPQRTLVLATANLPYAITISPSSASLGYVTVADVLGGLYAALRVHVSREEFAQLTAGNAKVVRRVSEAYTARYMRLHGHRGYAEEKAGGVRRVDFLMGHTKFRGLSLMTAPASGSPGQLQDVWRIHLA